MSLQFFELQLETDIAYTEKEKELRNQKVARVPFIELHIKRNGRIRIELSVFEVIFDECIEREPKRRDISNPPKISANFLNLLEISSINNEWSKENCSETDSSDDI